jgi:GNAT superfamily N-acetyltransferase
MGFLKNYIYKKKLKKLEDKLAVYKYEPNEYYQTEKFVKTKRGVPVYLIHCTYSEDGQVYSGNIHVLTTKGFDGTLSYIIDTKSQSIRICDIKHKLRNQGIGAQLLIYLDEIAKESSINKITGWLSPLDLDTHREKLLHFLSQNGYKIAEGKVPNLNIDGLIATKIL